MEEGLGLGTAPRPRRSRSSLAGLGLLVAMGFMFVGSLFHPATRCYNPASRLYSRAQPQSIEERVRKILSETPLIGKSTRPRTDHPSPSSPPPAPQRHPPIN